MGEYTLSMSLSSAMRSAGVKGCVLGGLEAASPSVVSISWENRLCNVHDTRVQPQNV